MIACTGWVIASAVDTSWKLEKNIAQRYCTSSQFMCLFPNLPQCDWNTKEKPSRVLSLEKKSKTCGQGDSPVYSELTSCGYGLTVEFKLFKLLNWHCKVEWPGRMHNCQPISQLYNKGYIETCIIWRKGLQPGSYQVVCVGLEQIFGSDTYYTKTYTT